MKNKTAVIDDRKVIRTKEFHRLLSEQSGFNLSDVVHFWKTFENIVFDILSNDEILHIAGFGKFHTTHVEGLDNAYDGLHNKRYKRDPFDKIFFQFSPTFKGELKKGRKHRQLEFDFDDQEDVD